MRTKLVSNYERLGQHSYCGHAVILGHQKYEWQEIEYILRLFGERQGIAKDNYKDFVRKGIEQGQRPDLTGGDLLRSYGGWSAVKSMIKSGDYQKGDERILGDGNFVTDVLAHAEEQFRNKYQIKAKGYDLKKLVDRVAEITKLTPKKILDDVRDRRRTDARSILSYWAKEKLGITQSEMARILNLSQAAITYAVRRGRSIVENNSYSILDG